MFGIHRASKLDTIRYPHLEEGWDRYPIVNHAAYIVAPRWFVRLLHLRDRAARRWVMFCWDHDLLRDGQKMLWPRWLTYGWS